MKYRCTMCGEIYDEEKSGVKFKDLPESWVCPVCGAPKSLFEPVAEAPAMDAAGNEAVANVAPVADPLDAVSYIQAVAENGEIPIGSAGEIDAESVLGSFDYRGTTSFETFGGYGSGFDGSRFGLVGEETAETFGADFSLAHELRGANRRDENRDSDGRAGSGGRGRVGGRRDFRERTGNCAGVYF